MDSDGRTRRSYTSAERERALRLYVEIGPAAAGRELEIPSATIRKWAQRAGTSIKQERAGASIAAIEGARQTWAQRRAELALRSGEAATRFLEQAIDAGSRGAADWMRAFKISIDAAQGLSVAVDREGGAQMRSKEDFDADVAELVNFVAEAGLEERARRGDADVREFLEWRRTRDGSAASATNDNGPNALAARRDAGDDGRAASVGGNGSSGITQEDRRAVELAHIEQ
jgi:transposase-like protein